MRDRLENFNRRPIRIALTVAVTAYAAILHAPQLLAFPYHAEVRGTPIYAERPIDPELPSVLVRADQRSDRAARTLGVRPVRPPTFLTEGGWRWSLLALTSARAAALTRPLRPAIIVNRAEVATDKMTFAASPPTIRTLSGTIAHERAHVIFEQRFGLLRAMTAPAWLREGWADVVGGDLALAQADVKRLRAAESRDPRLFYVDAVARTRAALTAHNGDLAAVLADR